MTERELFEAIGHVDDDLILAADAPVKKRRRVVHLHWQQVLVKTSISRTTPYTMPMEVLLSAASSLAA